VVDHSRQPISAFTSIRVLGIVAQLGASKMASKPLLTVIVPSFNQAKFIRDCLSEPLELASAGVELLVMDGGSSDETVEILKELLGDNDSWVSENDRGQAHAINKGLSRGRGQWVAFQNSDDFYVEGKLALVLEAMMSNNDCDVIVGGVALVEETGKVTSVAYPKPIVFSCLSQYNFIYNQAFFIRREFVDKVGVLDEKLQFCLDYEWFLRIFRAKPRIHYIYDVIGAQRHHAETKTCNMRDVHDAEWTIVTRQCFSFTERALGLVLLHPYRVFRFLYGLAYK
jgi:glycosyltransferase involved in cell wall biosynthesis